MPKAHLVYTGIYGFFFEDMSENFAGTVWALAPDARRDLVHPHLCWVIWDSNQRGDDTTLDEMLATVDPWRADAVEGLIEVQDVAPSRVELWKEGPYDRKHLVPLKRSHPDSGAVKLMDELITFSDDDLTTCKARIRNGCLDVTYVDRRWKWKFTHEGGPPEFLAQEVCHHFDLQGEPLRLRLGDALLHLESQQGEDVVVVLGNTPEEEIFPPATSEEEEEEDHHVKLFNRLAARRHRNPSALKPVPHPGGQPDPRHDHRFEHEAAAKVRRVHGANCPPGNWEESG